MEMTISGELKTLLEQAHRKGKKLMILDPAREYKKTPNEIVVGKQGQMLKVRIYNKIHDTGHNAEPYIMKLPKKSE